MASENTGEKLVWFLTGAAVGAVAALLYAPQSGKATRRFIRRKAEDGREAIVDAGKEILDRGHEFYEKGRQIADDAAGLVERGRKLVRG